MRYLYDTLTESEREQLKEELQMKQEMMEINHMMESAELEHQLRVSEIETKAVLEEYTYEELSAEYEKEMQIYTEGVKDLWAKFVAWIKSIFSKNEKNKPSEEDIKEAEKAAQEENVKTDNISTICKIIRNICTGIKQNVGKIIASGSVIVMGTLATVFSVKNWSDIKSDGIIETIKNKIKSEKVPATNLGQQFDNVMQAANDVKDTADYVEKNSEQLQKKAPEVLNKIKEIVSTVTKFISGKWNSLVEFVKKFCKKDSDGTPKVKGKVVSEEEYENVKKKNAEEREKNKDKVTDTTATVQDSVFDNLFDDDPIFESYSENQINELIELANSL